MHTLGIALERQQGVHAIGSDHRMDFDAWPGTLAYTPPGVEVFSESEAGGEYLVLRWQSDAYAEIQGNTQTRRQWMGQRHKLQAAHSLRRLLLSPVRDNMAIEQAALVFMQQEHQEIPTPSPRMRATYARVLDRIRAEFDQQITITQLATAEGKTPVRFLREFTQLVGMTPHAFIVETRLQAARDMMQRGASSLATVAMDCGFTHQSHMGSAFRKMLGQTPRQYLAMLDRRRGSGVTRGHWPGATGVVHR